MRIESFFLCGVETSTSFSMIKNKMACASQIDIQNQNRYPMRLLWHVWKKIERHKLIVKKLHIYDITQLVISMNLICIICGRVTYRKLGVKLQLFLSCFLALSHNLILRRTQVCLKIDQSHDPILAGSKYQSCS